MLKESFVDLRRRHPFAIQDLASQCGVGESVIVKMLEGKPVLKSIASHVLTVFSAIVKESYSLDNVEIAVVGEPQSELAQLLAQLDQEAEAATNGLYGLSEGNARHKFITTRLEKLITPYYDTLKQANQGGGQR